jgi:acetylornithine deacetylase/succinyl-diaminopimelate desuccinylase-like protein
MMIPSPAPPSLLGDARVQPLRTLARETDDETLAEQLELVAIPAPPFGEQARGAWVLERFRALGLADAGRDDEGNVLGAIPGAEPALGPVVVAAHLDTVFAADTALTPRREEGRIYVPGITDNARGLAAMLAVARLLARARVRPRRTVVFAATVGEEGPGDLRGVKHLFRDGAPLRAAGAFVALDGSGLRRIVHRAIGSRRLRVEVAGPGGHSWADRGAANPILALGTAVARLAELALPEAGRTALTVARIGGGTSINAIPDGAWMELDLRADAPGVLPKLEESVRAILARAVDEENTRRRAGTDAIEPQVTVIGDRPSGETPARDPLVQAAEAITYALGQKPELVGSSTDANVPMALGIPAIAIGAGGDSGGIHTTDEWYSNENGALGIERALLIILAAAGIA